MPEKDSKFFSVDGKLVVEKSLSEATADMVAQQMEKRGADFLGAVFLGGEEGAANQVIREMTGILCGRQPPIQRDYLKLDERSNPPGHYYRALRITYENRCFLVYDPGRRMRNTEGFYIVDLDKCFGNGKGRREDLTERTLEALTNFRLGETK